jgi:hypothetical protein
LEVMLGTASAPRMPHLLPESKQRVQTSADDGIEREADLRDVKDNAL